MPNGTKVSVGTNIVYGIIFFVVVAVTFGLVVFLSIVISDEDAIYFSVIFGMMIIYFTPIIAFIIGLIQGKLARSEEEALIAGGVTGTIGFFILMFIVMGSLVLSVSIKSPSYVDIEIGELIGPWIALFIPNGIIGALSAILSMRFLFAVYPPQLPLPGAPTYEQGPQIKLKPPQQSAPSVEEYATYHCPHCRTPFGIQIPDRPKRIECPSCGRRIIIGLE